MGDPDAGRIDLSIVHPFDPWAQGVGGYDTWLDGLLGHAPPRWGIEVVGVTAEAAARPPGRWIDAEFRGRRIRFLGALLEPQPDRVRRVPLSLRFAAACRLRRIRASGRIVQYDRFESSFAVPPRAGQRTSFLLHNAPDDLLSAASDVRWRRLGFLFRLLLSARLRSADRVACTAPGAVPLIEKRIPALRGRVAWQPYFADPERFSPGSPEDRAACRREIRERMGLPTESRVVLFAGRLESQKDPGLLVEAFAVLASRRPEAALAIAGQGRLEGFLAGRIGALGLSARCRLLGPVDRSRLVRIYRGCDVAACTSAYESGPLFAFEALACGLPVVSRDVGQVPMLLDGREEAGRVVLEAGVPAFAAALESALLGAPDPGAAVRCAEAVRPYAPSLVLASLFDGYAARLRDGGRPVDCG